MHVDVVKKAVALPRVARDAGANDVFPSGQAAFIARDDVVEVEVFALEDFAAILAGIFVPFEDVVPGKFHFFLRHPVKHHEDDDARDADFEVNGVDHFLLGIAMGNVAPTLEIVGGEIVARLCEDDLRLPLEEQRKRAFYAADIHGLPEPVQHQHGMV